MTKEPKIGDRITDGDMAATIVELFRDDDDIVVAVVAERQDGKFLSLAVTP
jgi:hypothetical protein